MAEEGRTTKFAWVTISAIVSGIVGIYISTLSGCFAPSPKLDVQNPTSLPLMHIKTIAVDITNESHFVAAKGVVVDLRVLSDSKEKFQYTIVPGDFCEKSSSFSAKADNDMYTNGDRVRFECGTIAAREVRKFGLLANENPTDIEVYVNSDEAHQLFGFEMTKNACTPAEREFAGVCYRPYRTE